ncbi:MAG: Hsp20/alpha crystallin family protein [Symbiobacterium sp.]|uniref:Hsp20/alpha crystallin family protein n=1 Tax=Symbiobacterium sp. TaxID=1971213 RepID=UPI003463B95F
MMFYPMRRWNPFDMLDRMMSQWEQYFFGGPWPALPSMPTPQLDVQQGEQETVIRVAVPGVSPEDLSVSVDGDVLTIKAVHRGVQLDGGDGREAVATFERSFTLPPSIDPDKVTARYTHGVLEIHLPRAEGRRGRQIPIDLA